MAATVVSSELNINVVEARRSAPRYTIDPWWPKPLPDGWINGQLAGVCTDSKDNVIVTNRGDITKEEEETCVKAPAVLIFDNDGDLIDAWGDWELLPRTVHSCAVDDNDNIWITANGDGMIQKYTPDGKLLLQIGTKGVYDTSDGTRNGTPLNSGKTAFIKPAGITVDRTNGDVYVADGYGNRRVAVFDKNGNYLRQWGRQATPEESEAGVGGVFAEVVHDVKISNAGLVYVCDRQGDRVQVFDKMGNFKRNIWIRNGTPTLPDRRGTAWWLEFSRDPEQKYLFVMNGRNEQVHILDHASGEILSSFGRPGHQLGNFTHGHSLALDSKSNLFVAETNYGRRVNKFVLA